MLQVVTNAQMTGPRTSRHCRTVRDRAWPSSLRASYVAKTPRPLPTTC